MKQSLDTPTIHLAAAAFLLAAALIVGACWRCEVPDTARLAHGDSPILVEIEGTTLNFPQKDTNLPLVGRTRGDTEVTLTFEFKAIRPAFKTLALTDFRAYRFQETERVGWGWFPESIRFPKGGLSLKMEEMAILAGGETLIKEITLGVSSEGPLLIVPTAVLEVAPVPAGEREGKPVPKTQLKEVPKAMVRGEEGESIKILVIDPPPIWIYP